MALRHFRLLGQLSAILLVTHMATPLQAQDASRPTNPNKGQQTVPGEEEPQTQPQKKNRQDASPEQEAVEQLQGNYRITAGEKGGEKLPPERLKDITVRIAENAFTTFDRDKKEVYGASFDLDVRDRPWKIKMKSTLVPVGPKGTTSEGLIEKEGNVVKLIYALPGGKTPTDFKTDTHQQMFVLEKVSDDPAVGLPK